MTYIERHELLLKAKPILFNTEMVRAILDGRKTVTRRVLKKQDADRTFNFDYVLDKNGTIYAADLYSDNGNNGCCTVENKAPYLEGDILYVREAWKRFCGMLYGWGNGTYIPLDDFEGYQYKADEQCICTKGINPFCDGFDDQKRDISFDDKWHPSIHMPKEAARIFLRVTNVRVERLQDITEDDIVNEGAEKLILCPDEYGIIEPDGTLGDMCWNTGCCGGNCKYIDKSYGELFGEIVWDGTIKPKNLSKYGWAANPFVWVIEFERIG